MAENARLIDNLAEAVIDGTPIDWEAAATADESGGRLVAHLRIVAAVAQLHRTTQSPDTIESPAPETWGHLKILERIGRGASGSVYRAWDSRLDREVALKLIPVSPVAALGDEELPQSIIKEGRLLARVRHPNIAMIHGADQIGDRIGLWMELVRGRTLEELLRTGKTFTPKQVLDVGVQLARAVAAVHAAGLLHRDIKAQNVMQSEDGRIVLMDFGTGRELVDERTDLAGTPLYLAPEVFAGQAASAQSDVYSLGILLYHLLTGSYPVQGRTPADVRRAHAQHERIDLRSQRPEAPARLVRAIERAIDPVPARRYPSADALRHELDKLTRRSLGRWLGYVAAAALGIALVTTARGFIEGPRALALSSPVLPVGSPPAIAVLPFKNLSSEADSQLVVDGLTYGITQGLAAIEGLSVRSSAASFTFQGPAVDIRAVGRELNVNLVLTGAVLASDGQIRVSAELVRVADLFTVWSDTFRLTGDSALTHDAISLAVVNRLRLQVGQGQRRYRIDPHLDYLFLKARGLMARRNLDNAGRAAKLFEQVIAQEPAYAPAWAGLASALGELSRRATPSESLPPTNPRMDAAAWEAIRLDPLLADAQSAMGSLRARDREWGAAEEAFHQALKLDPSLTTTYTEFVLWVLEPMGRYNEALAILEEARAAEPRSLDVRRVMALVQVNSGLYEDAIASARWVLEQDPNFYSADISLGRALMVSGHVTEAQAIEAQAIFERHPDRFGYLGYLYAVTNRREEAEALAAARADAPARQMLIYCGLGDKDRAMEALDKVAATDKNWWRAATWMHRPEMALLRGDPRLNAIKKRLGLPPVTKPTVR